MQQLIRGYKFIKMKYLLTILFLVVVAIVHGQSTVHLRGDTIKAYKEGGNATFRLMNDTRDSTNGVLLNIGNGITKFSRIRAISASQFVVGTDTIEITGASAPTATIYTGDGTILDALRVVTFTDSLLFTAYTIGSWYSVTTRTTGNDGTLTYRQGEDDNIEISAYTNFLSFSGKRGEIKINDTMVLISADRGGFGTPEYYSSTMWRHGGITSLLRGDSMFVRFDHFTSDDDSAALIFPIVGTTNTGLFSLAFDSTNGHFVRIPMSGGSEEPTATIDNHAVAGYALLDMTEEDFVYAKRLVAGSGITLDSTNEIITISSDAVTSLAELTDVDITTTPPEDGWYLSYDEDLEKWVATEPQNVYPILVGDSLKITNGIDTSSGVFLDGGGGGCATCWDWDNVNTIGATGVLGSADNFGFGIYTNNTLRGEVTNGGVLLWSGASAIGSRKAEFADTSGMAYLRLGPQPTAIASSVALNARLVITGSGTTSSTATLAVLNSAGTQHFTIRDDGSVTMPPIFGSITSTNLRMAGATVTYGVGNGAGTTGSLMSFTPLTTSTNIGVTNTNVVEINGTYQEIAPYDDAGIHSALSIKPTYNGTAGKGPGYVAGITFRSIRTDIPDYRASNIIDSGYTYTNGAIHIANTKSVPSSGNYTVAKEDYFLLLNDVSGANRNVVLSDPLTNGRILVIFNTSADATFKWSFSGETVRDAAGTTYTTLTDGKCYTIIYNYGEWLLISISP